MSIAPNPGAAGYVARMNREPIRSCPDKGREHQKAWEAGWLRADTEFQKKVKYAVFVYRYGDTGETYSTFALATDVEYGQRFSQARTVFEHAKDNDVKHVGTWYVVPKAKSVVQALREQQAASRRQHDAAVRASVAFQIADAEASKTR